MRNTEIQGGFSSGDNLFKRGQYRAAAKAYYELFYCRQGTELNPHVSEAGNVYSEFQAAVALAVGGNFSLAAKRMQSIKHELPPFTEAGYLAGNFQWVTGNHELARRLWRDTITGTRFARPPDSVPDSDAAQSSAQQMLKWSLKQ